MTPSEYNQKENDYWFGRGEARRALDRFQVVEDCELPPIPPKVYVPESWSQKLARWQAEDLRIEQLAHLEDHKRYSLEELGLGHLRLRSAISQKCPICGTDTDKPGNINCSAPHA